MQMNRLAVTALLVTLISGCVSQSTLVETNRVGEPRTDMTEAARTRMSLGLNYLQRGDMSQAKYNLEKASQMAPDMAEIDNAIAYYNQQVGETVLAEQSYRQSLRKDSNNPDTLNNFGVFLCQLHKFEEAERLLRKAIENPRYIRVADSYENLAYCAMAQQDYTNYQQYLRQSLQHNGNRVSAVYLMAEFAYASGDLPDAKKWIVRLEQLEERSAPATLLQYLLAKQTGDIVVQQRAQQFLTEVHPQSEETLMLLNDDLRQSRPEKLRQAYQASLLQSGATPVTAEPTAQPSPKLKVLKRKAPVKLDPSTARPAQLPKGETLASLARQYQIEPSDRAQLNSVSLSAEQSKEQLLMAPASAKRFDLALNHQLEQADPLLRIAEPVNLGVDHLFRWNQMKAASQLPSGQTITLRDHALFSL
jgi:type IV pilus assembly protein PilF